MTTAGDRGAMQALSRWLPVSQIIDFKILLLNVKNTFPIYYKIRWFTYKTGSAAQL